MQKLKNDEVPPGLLEHCRLVPGLTAPASRVVRQKPAQNGCRVFGAGILAVMLWTGVPGYAQVAPAEIVNPELKAAEQSYMPQMTAVIRAVAGIKFPFTFLPSRYAGLDLKDQVGSDTRGLEFVHFHGRLVLKLTGNYNASYNADLLTQNQRAGHVFEDVVAPILCHFSEHFAAGDRFDAFGFEIAYHTRTHAHGFGYEGKEIFVLVIDKADALAFADPAFKRQEALNRSEIFLDGKPLGLALGARDPFDVESLQRSLRSQPAAGSRTEVSAPPAEPAARAQSQTVRPIKLSGTPGQPPATPPAPGEMPLQKQAENPASPSGLNPDGMQKRYQTQLDDLAKEGVAKHHFVDYAPPSFVVVRDQIALQFTLRNPTAFDMDATSIYKRAAQSFDLFLAPQLKPILDKVPGGAELGSLDVTVINPLTSKTGSSSEAVEFIFPLQALRRFVDAEITNQDLINQSLVLVNGVRIALNLQLVE